MLLREFDQAEDFLGDLENILNLFLKDYDKQNSPAKISFQALNGWLQDSGSYGSVNKDVITSAIGKSPKLRELIKTPVGMDGITLNTDVQNPEDPPEATPDLEKTDQGISKTTAQAASHAAQQSLAQ